MVFNRIRLEYLFYLHTKQIIKDFRDIKKPIIYDIFWECRKNYYPRFTKKDYNNLLIRSHYIHKKWAVVYNNDDITKKEKRAIYDKLIIDGSKTNIKYMFSNMADGLRETEH